MTETRTDRTDYLGLLALMVASANSEGWAFPYWNQVQIDAALNGLANALRDGTVPLQASATAPTLALETSGGYLSAGQTLGVVQTFVDEWGRETDAGAEATVSTGTGIADPAVALAIGTPASEATGFEGGLLEVWYSWTDASGGETLASPSAQVDLPYLPTGLYSQVTVTLPATPASVGASGANIYIRHRGGNIVMAAVIIDDSETDCLLDGDVYNCYRSIPLANSTGSTRLVKITGAAAPTGAELTRFYVRVSGQDWTDGDCRLRVGGVDEYDPDTVSYPLLYTGAHGELAPGWPPTVSQVKAIRPIDLATEVTGTLDDSHLPAEATLEAELVKSIGEGLLSGFAVTPNDPADMKVDVATGEVLLAAGRFTPAAIELTIPTADETYDRIDIVVVQSDGSVEGPTEDAALKGTPAETPAAPSTPSGAIKLAEVLVGVGTTTIETADITDSRTLVPTLVAHENDAEMHFTGTEKADRLLSTSQFDALTDGGETALHSHAGGGPSDPELTRELAALLVLSDTDYSIRERVAGSCFLDNFSDEDGTNQSETHDAIDTTDERLECPVGVAGADGSWLSGTTSLGAPGAVKAIGQDINKDAAQSRYISYLAVHMPSGAQGGHIYVDLYEISALGTRPSTNTPLVHHTTQDFSTGVTVNGVTNCVVWDSSDLGNDFLLEANKYYQVVFRCSVNLDYNNDLYALNEFNAGTYRQFGIAENVDVTTTNWYKYNDNAELVKLSTRGVDTPSEKHWTSTTQSVPDGIKKLFADWNVSQEPETGGTIEAQVKYGSGSWGTLAKGENADVADAPTSVAFRFNLENADDTTEIRITDFGAIWELDI